MDEETIIAAEDELLYKVQRARTAMMKDMYVFTMSLAQLTRP